MLASMENDTMTTADLADPTVVPRRNAPGDRRNHGQMEAGDTLAFESANACFGELHSIPGITQHILTAQLRELGARQQSVLI
jgi:hypothetical protein